jgi:hypothetical protein
MRMMLRSETKISPAERETLTAGPEFGEKAKLVGLGGLEPPTSPLSGVRSSHLSYRPINNLRSLFLDRCQ